VLADDVADDARRLLVGPIPIVAELAHRVQHAPVHGLQPVAHVGQRAPDDDAHRVVEIRLAHLVFEIDWEDFLTYGHRLSSIKYGPPSTRPRRRGGDRKRRGFMVFRAVPTTVYPALALPQRRIQVPKKQGGSLAQ